ncbi:MAG: hypothetical protein KKD39_08780 [Candidatus Altiarchaeota archaeon]|nr:hypothetical protein [Candidatus Altiarchaeota archaeon]
MMGAQNRGCEKNGMNSLFGENQILVLILPDYTYTESLTSVVSDLSKFASKICYVSLNRPYTSLLTLFKKQNVVIDNIHFIDAITATATTP